MVDDAVPPLRHVRAIAPGLVAVYRPRAAGLCARIADEVCAEVAGYAHPALRPVVAEAISSAVEVFLDVLAGAPVRGGALAAHFGALGAMEADAGHDLDAMRAAHQVVTMRCWTEVRAVVAATDDPRGMLDEIADAVLAYQQWLHEHAVRGYLDQQRRVAAPRRRAQARAGLLAGLAAGVEPERASLLAARAGLVWPPSGPLAVIAAAPCPRARATTSGLPALVDGVLHGQLLVVVRAGEALGAARAIVAAAGQAVALSAPVVGGPALASSLAHAIRWASRALRLLQEGVLRAGPDGVVRCEEHRAALWLHADPVLREQVAAEVLAPLLSVAGRQREVLARTMLVWLQTRASAPVVAERLGVHHQTVRNRLRRLREIFGATLDDPEQATLLLQSLEVLVSRSEP